MTDLKVYLNGKNLMSTIKECPKRCGECCKWWVYFEKHDSKSFNEAFIERLKVTKIRVYRCLSKNEEFNCFFVPYRCPQLSKNNLCKLHGKNKPKHCNTFPLKSTSYVLPDKCIYSSDENNIPWKKLKRII
jgi:hypothetical protein